MKARNGFEIVLLAAVWVGCGGDAARRADGGAGDGGAAGGLAGSGGSAGTGEAGRPAVDAAISAFDAAASRDAGVTPVACAFTPCGGDVVGRWTQVSACGPDRVIGPVDLRGCDDGSTISASYALTGAVESFSPDGGYTSTSTRTNQRQLLHLGRTCIERVAAARDAGAPTCDGFAELLRGGLPDGGAITCVDRSGGGCDCTESLPDATSTPAPGSWSVKNNLLVTMTTGGPTLSRPYCVRDGRFELKDAWLLGFVRAGDSGR